MELTHDFVVPAPIDTAWATFMDLERVGNCFPGASVTEASGETFAGTVKVKLGPIALVYAGSGLFLERDDASHRAVIEAKGKDKRGNGTAGATVTLQLAPAEGGAATRVDVTTELAITGKPAQFGRGVMQDVSDKLLQQFVGCIEDQFAASSDDSADQPTEAGEESDATADAGAAPASPAAATGDAPVAAAPAAPATLQAAATSRPVAAAAPVSSAAKPAVSRHAKDDSVDLGATVLPVLIKAYAPHAIGALVAVALGYVLGRRSRR